MTKKKNTCGSICLENVLFVLDSLRQYNESSHSKIPIENYIFYCRIIATHYLKTCNKRF